VNILQQERNSNILKGAILSILTGHKIILRPTSQRSEHKGRGVWVKVTSQNH